MESSWSRPKKRKKGKHPTSCPRTRADFHACGPAGRPGAEALYRYRQGEQAWLKPELQAAQAETNEAFRRPDEFFDAILEGWVDRMLSEDPARPLQFQDLVEAANEARNTGNSDPIQQVTDLPVLSDLGRPIGGLPGLSPRCSRSRPR